MSKRLIRAVTAFLCVCLCLSGAFFMPTRAFAETVIDKVLTTTSYTPVAMMEVSFITAATSTDGCMIGSYNWYDSQGEAETEVFDTNTYTVVIRVDALDGYVFAEDVAVYLNNGSVSAVRDDAGRSLTITKEYAPMLWQPTVIKNPGGETVTEGGWASFVATATYTASYKWSLRGDGGTYGMESAVQKFPGLTYDGDGTGKLNLYNIPLALNGWKAICTFTGPGGSVESGGALISVKPDPAKAMPTPPPTPTPTPAPSETPATTDAPDGEEHTHEFDGAWHYDDSNHWRLCTCGEKGEIAPHTMKWTDVREATRKEDGLREGLCEVCGYKTSESVPYEKPAGGVSVIRWVLTGVIGIAAVLLVLLLIGYISDKRRRKRRRKHRH